MKKTIQIQKHPEDRVMTMPKASTLKQVGLVALLAVLIVEIGLAVAIPLNWGGCTAERKVNGRNSETSGIYQNAAASADTGICSALAVRERVLNFHGSIFKNSKIQKFQNFKLSHFQILKFSKTFPLSII